MIRIFSIYLLCLTSAVAAETGYRVVHPDGSVEFTDQPVKGAEPITLPEIPTYSSPNPVTTAPTSDAQGQNGQPEKKTIERSISIVSPAPEETLWFNEEGMRVSVRLSSPLGKGEKVAIRLNGSVVASGSQTSFTLKEIYRGAHMLSAAIVSSQGSVISESSPITFYMRQHSVLDKQP